MDGASCRRHDSAIAATEVQLRRQASSGSVRLGWSIVLVALAAQTAAYLTNELVLGGRYHQLDAAADRTPFAWANTLAIVVSPSSWPEPGSGAR